MTISRLAIQRVKRANAIRCYSATIGSECHSFLPTTLHLSKIISKFVVYNKAIFMKKLLTPISAVITACCILSSCKNDDGGRLKKSDILGTWYAVHSSTQYENILFNKDGTYDECHYGTTHNGYQPSLSGRYSFDPYARTWVKHRNDGHSYTYVIMLLDDTTFSFADLEGGHYTWTRTR